MDRSTPNLSTLCLPPVACSHSLSRFHCPCRLRLHPHPHVLTSSSRPVPSYVDLSNPSTDLLRSITDPEHPLTLEQLAVVSSSQISFPHKNQLLVEFTPTIPHCSMATLIGTIKGLPVTCCRILLTSCGPCSTPGLSLRVRLLRALPERYKVDIRVKQGSHQSENAGTPPLSHP
jgi:hypothetical protein